MPLSITPHDALLVVDMQNDFMPGGALGVTGGDEIVPLVNQLLELFQIRVFSRDWHPANHSSFSDNPTFTDNSWPAHCVQDTAGAQFHQDLKTDLADKIVSKATTVEQEAYSAFQNTDLENWLQQKGIQRVFIVGLATDYCVKFSALDAQEIGFDTYVIRNATRGVDNPPGNEIQQVQTMENAGIHIIYSKNIFE
ncbi:nicotinamidase [bacterium]|nr:nicotinamidase [bacterium]